MCDDQCLVQQCQSQTFPQKWHFSKAKIENLNPNPNLTLFQKTNFLILDKSHPGLQYHNTSCFFFI